MSACEGFNENLQDREWLYVYQATKDCPLTFGALLIHGYLRRRRKAEVAPDYKTISAETGTEAKRATPRAVAELIGHRLAVKDGRGYRALEPGDEHVSWFPQRTDGRGPRYFRVYLLADRNKKTAKLTPTANALYWLMASLESRKLKDGTSRLLRNTRSGLATMIGVDRKTARTGLTSLGQLGLFFEDADGLHLNPPTDPELWIRKKEQVKNGKDVRQAEPKPEDFRKRWGTLEGADGENLDMLTEVLADSWNRLREAGYYQSDASKFFTFARENMIDVFHALTFFGTALPEILLQADAWHEKSVGKYRNSLFALIAICRKRSFAGTRPKYANSPG